MVVRRMLAEFGVVGAVLMSLALAWWAVVSVHRQGLPAPGGAEPADAPSVVVPPAPPRGVIALEPPPAPKPEPEPDPTLLNLARAADAEKAAAAAAERRGEELARATAALRSRTKTLRDRASLIKARSNSLLARESEAAREADKLEALRDVLARHRNEMQHDLEMARLRAKDGYAVLPFKGPHGTWRRPIAIECVDGQARVMPGGRSFSLLELSSNPMGIGGAPLVDLVERLAREAAIQESPDGQAIVPYILFVIRPDGIRPYYQARSQLESLGIAFGYELVDSSVPIDFPDLRDLTAWTDEPSKPVAAIPGGSVTGGPVPAVDSRWQGSATDEPGGVRSEPGGGGSISVATRASDSHEPAGRAAGDGTPAEGTPADPFVWSQRREATARMTNGSQGGPSEGSGLTADLGGFSVTEAGGGGAEGEATPGALANPRDSMTRLGGGGGAPATTGSSAAAASTAAAAGNPGAMTTAAPGAGFSGGGDSRRTPDLHGRPDIVAHARDMDGSLAEALAPVVGNGSGLTRLGEALTEAGGLPPARPSGGGDETASFPGGAGAISLGSGQPPGGGASTPPGVGIGRGTGRGDGRPDEPPGPERRLELVVVCGGQGILVHPGAYRLDMATLKTSPGRSRQLLQAVVARKQAQNPATPYRPEIRFLVEGGGQAAFETVRRELLFSEVSEWPVALQVVEGELHGKAGGLLR